MNKNTLFIFKIVIIVAIMVASVAFLLGLAVAPHNEKDYYKNGFHDGYDAAIQSILNTAHKSYCENSDKAIGFNTKHGTIYYEMNRDASFDFCGDTNSTVQP